LTLVAHKNSMKEIFIEIPEKRDYKGNLRAKLKKILEKNLKRECKMTCWFGQHCVCSNEPCVTAMGGEFLD